jgi:hypothetical protein
MSKIAVLEFEDGGRQVVTGVTGITVTTNVNPILLRQEKLIVLKGYEHNYSYIDTFFAPIKKYMLFENESDLVYENGRLVGYRTTTYFEERK